MEQHESVINHTDLTEAPLGLSWWQHRQNINVHQASQPPVPAPETAKATWSHTFRCSAAGCACTFQRSRDYKEHLLGCHPQELPAATTYPKSIEIKNINCSDTDLYELYNSNGNGPPDCNSQHAPIDVSHIADSSTLKQIREVKEVDSHQTYDKVLLEEFIPSAQCMVDSKKPEDGHKKVQQVDKPSCIFYDFEVNLHVTTMFHQHLCIDHFPCNAGWNNGTAELLFTTLSSFGKLRLYIGYWPVFTAEIHM
ncbi:hypothetical protein C8T65DRAFT_700085 [Cerioporus squamosus]|nr:hypothetical protein C8T65DRAFT_700085 [Cerioporus squamosus]